jgi:hypothetical protein
VFVFKNQDAITENSQKRFLGDETKNMHNKSTGSSFALEVIVWP